MERWEGKVAVVTGAGSGIGAAITASLLQHGMVVVGLDKDQDRLQEFSNNLGKQENKFHYVKADLRKEKDILDAFSWIENNLGGVHVFVNNAGLLGKVKLVSECDFSEWKNVFDVNVLALSICTKEAITSMKKHNIDDGNIINIASVAAHMSRPLPGFVMYTASKKAVHSITEGVRIELAMEKSNIKITTICPGVVNTPLYETAGHALSSNMPCLKPEDIAKSIVFCLQMPPTTQVTELHVRPIREDLIGI